MAPQISIIIPVYNSATTIERCIVSIIQQDFKDFEVLLVDDGSSDNSLDEINRLSKIDSRLLAFGREHAGVSATRNFALDNARGKYIVFVDCDDYVEPYYLSTMYAYRDCDMVICGYYVDYVSTNGVLERKDVQSLPLKGKYNISPYCDKIIELFTTGKIHINCNKLLKKSIIDGFHIRYESIPINEDYTFMLEYLKHSSSIYAADVASYHWVRVNGEKSGVDSMPENLIDIYITAHRRTNDLFSSDSFSCQIFYYTYEFVARKYMTAANNGTISHAECRRLLKRMFSLNEVKEAYRLHHPHSLGEMLSYGLLKYHLFSLYKLLFI